MSTRVMSDLLWTGVWLVGRKCSLCLLANPEKCLQYENVLICYCCSISSSISQPLWLCALFDPVGPGNLLLYVEWIC